MGNEGGGGGLVGFKISIDGRGDSKINCLFGTQEHIEKITFQSLSIT